jgi:hypothetical protein
LLNREEALLHSNLTHAATGFAGYGLRSWGSTRSTTRLTLAEGRELDLRLISEHGLFEIELQIVAKIGASVDLPSAAPASAAENISKHITEDVAEGIRCTEASWPTAARKTLMPVLIVDRTLLWIREDLVRFLGFLELVLGFVIVRVAIGMEFHRQAPIGFFDFGFRRGTRDIENQVVIPLGHFVFVNGRVLTVGSRSARLLLSC